MREKDHAARLIPKVPWFHAEESITKATIWIDKVQNGPRQSGAHQDKHPMYAQQQKNPATLSSRPNKEQWTFNEPKSEGVLRMGEYSGYNTHSLCNMYQTNLMKDLLSTSHQHLKVRIKRVNGAGYNGSFSG